ncbi:MULTISPECIES: mechanosensitive ion channel domain-containing protein [unclassified Aureispira]|uniref:mechanosensitive ion channel domain-containing protein n=1 Tax=unclassified Aureispira TaxID=2649989 RepID=UPI0006978130|nr:MULTISPECIES: mechanosensitive ion channel domain-containing protein [unclassified Aureispira]WMX16648.1 mechanosensitive ion channel [Aureispira sp. CCB-E]
MKKTFIQALAIVTIMIFKRYKIHLLNNNQIEWVKEIDVAFVDVLLNYVYFLLILSFAKGAIFFWYRKSKKIPQERSDNIILGVNNIHALVVGVVTVLTGLALMGIDVKAFFASLSIIAAAIAIISKDYISNVIGGMLIAFSNDVNLGDYIKVGGNKGKVIDMSITMFSLLTDDDDVVIIPNNMVYALDVINYTKRAIKKTSIEFEISLDAIATVSQLEADLIATLNEFDPIIQSDSYNLKAVGIKKDYVEFKFQYILDIPDREKEKDIRKKVIRRVVQIIKKVDSSL